VALLLDALLQDGAEEQVAVLLAREPALHVSLNDPVTVGRLLYALRTLGEDGQAAALIARDPATHVPIDDGFAVGMLLDGLREAGADGQADVLAERAATGTSLDDPSNVARLLQALRRAGADNAAAKLLARNPAEHVPINNSDAVQSLLRVLRQERVEGQVATLTDRLSAAGLFRLLSTAAPAGRFVFGREPDGSPAGPWGWDDIM
jgi:hypothetical protein